MHATVYFKSADGVQVVKLPANEALSCTRKHPHEWSLTRVFADPPEAGPRQKAMAAGADALPAPV